MAPKDVVIQNDPAEDTEVSRVMMALYPEVIGGRAVFRPQPEHRGKAGWLQGGLAATVLDHVLASVAAEALNHRVVTGTLDVRYPHPVLLAGGPYDVVAQAEEARGGLVRVSGAIVDHNAKALVEAKALFVAYR